MADRLLLETSAVDGYLLEDGTGVLLLDVPPPAVRLGVDTATSVASPLTSGSFTPAANDLLVVFVGASGTVDTTATLTSSVAGQTFTRVFTQVQSTVHVVVAFVADVLSTAVAQTVTVDFPADVSTGQVLTVLRVSGMTRTGTSALLQSAGTWANIGATPNVVFTSATLTANPVLVGLRNNTNPAGITPPTSFSELSDSGYSGGGGETAARASGHTSATVTWGAASATQWSATGLELDASAAGGGAVTVTPGVATLTATRFAPTVTATANQTVTVGTASLTLATFAPTATGGAGLTVVPGKATLTTTGLAPIVSTTQRQTVTPSTATLVLAGFVPLVIATDHRVYTVGKASLVLTALAPSVTFGAVPIPGYSVGTALSYGGANGFVTLASATGSTARLGTSSGIPSSSGASGSITSGGAEGDLK